MFFPIETEKQTSAPQPRFGPDPANSLPEVSDRRVTGGLALSESAGVAREERPASDRREVFQGRREFFAPGYGMHRRARL